VQKVFPPRGNGEGDPLQLSRAFRMLRTSSPRGVLNKRGDLGPDPIKIDAQGFLTNRQVDPSREEDSGLFFPRRRGWLGDSSPSTLACPGGPFDVYSFFPVLPLPRRKTTGTPDDPRPFRQRTLTGQTVADKLADGPPFSNRCASHDRAIVLWVFSQPSASGLPALVFCLRS